MRSHAPGLENGSPPSGLRTCRGFHLVGRSFSNLVSLRRGCRARETSLRRIESLILTGAASPYVLVDLHHNQSYDRLLRSARLPFDHMIGNEVLTSLVCQNDVERSVLAGADKTPASWVRGRVAQRSPDVVSYSLAFFTASVNSGTALNRSATKP